MLHQSNLRRLWILDTKRLHRRYNRGIPGELCCFIAHIGFERGRTGRRDNRLGRREGKDVARCHAVQRRTVNRNLVFFAVFKTGAFPFVLFIKADIDIVFACGAAFFDDIDLIVLFSRRNLRIELIFAPGIGRVPSDGNATVAGIQLYIFYGTRVARSSLTVKVCQAASLSPDGWFLLSHRWCSFHRPSALPEETA